MEDKLGTYNLKILKAWGCGPQDEASKATNHSCQSAIYIMVQSRVCSDFPLSAASNETELKVQALVKARLEASGLPLLEARYCTALLHLQLLLGNHIGFFTFLASKLAVEALGLMQLEMPF